jgi:hypothetical protein
MSVLNGLKLVVSKKYTTASPVVQRRNKLANRLHEQIELCEAKKQGASYAPKKLKAFTNKQTGERMTVEVAKKIREWFWVNEAGKINLAIRYGAKTIPLNKKGANAIELNTSEELINTLKSIKVAVLNGDLDDAITEVSDATKAAFVK